MRVHRSGLLASIAGITFLAGCGTARDVNTGSVGIHVAGYGNPVDAVFHGPDAVRFLAKAPGATDCTNCHAADLNGAFGPSCNQCHLAAGWASPVWQSNCTFCHGTKNVAFDYATQVNQAAPPPDVAGETSGDRVGAHQKHLTAGTRSNGFVCSTCHAVPDQTTPLAHVDGAATVALQSVGQASLPANLGTYDQTAKTCATYCHGATLQGGSAPNPAWTATLACDGCHGLTPPTGRHATNFEPHAFMATNCALCHLTVVDTELNVLDKARHVNGVVDVRLVTGTFEAGTCSNVACHGPASPPVTW